MAETPRALFQEIKAQLEDRLRVLQDKERNRRAILRDEENRPIGDDADKMNANQALSIEAKLADVELAEIASIKEALLRLDLGEFGVCLDCEDPISPARLRAVPTTRLCITCKEKNDPPIHRPRSCRSRK